MITVYERPGGLYSPDTISAKPFAVVSHNHNQVVFPCFPPPLGGRQIHCWVCTPVDTPITSVARMTAAVVGGRLVNLKGLLVDVLATERLHGYMAEFVLCGKRFGSIQFEQKLFPCSGYIFMVAGNSYKYIHVGKHSCIFLQS